MHKHLFSRRTRAIGSILLTAAVGSVVSAASAETALAAETVAVEASVELTEYTDAQLAATPAVFGAAAAAAAGAFALKAVYDVGVAAGEWAARRLAGRAVAAEYELAGTLEQQSISAEVLLD